jgi:hypothetical protein
MKNGTTVVQLTLVEPFNSAGQNTTIMSSRPAQEIPETEKIDSKNNSEPKEQQNRLNILNTTATNRSRKSQLFDELIEVGSYLHLCSIQL